jgi:hypothetical protein
MINLKSARESTVKAGESEINRAAFPISGGPSGQSNGAKFWGQLEMGFFQQSFQLILRAHFVAGLLVPSARDGAPQTLFGIGHKAEGQFIGHQPLHQPFGVGKVPLGALAAPRLDCASARCNVLNMGSTFPSSSQHRVVVCGISGTKKEVRSPLIE